MSSVETGQMCAVDTGQMSAVETRHMSSVETVGSGQTLLGQSPFSQDKP